MRLTGSAGSSPTCIASQISAVAWLFSVADYGVIITCVKPATGSILTDGQTACHHVSIIVDCQRVLSACGGDVTVPCGICRYVAHYHPA